MFELIIKKNKSKNFTKAIDCALELGGTFDGKEIRIKIDDDLHIYDKIFPILKYNVTNWVGTSALFNGREVHPYRFMLQKHLSVRTAVSEVLNRINRSGQVSRDYTYYKREGNRFFYKNDDFSFDLELKGKELYEFLEEYEIGDVFVFKKLSYFY